MSSGQEDRDPRHRGHQSTINQDESSDSSSSELTQRSHEDEEENEEGEDDTLENNSPTSNHNHINDHHPHHNLNHGYYNDDDGDDNDLEDDDEEEEEDEAGKEREIISDLMFKFNGQGLVTGGDYFLVEKRWWNSWAKYVEYESYRYHTRYPRPVSVDNSVLLEKDGETVKPFMNENSDFVFVTKEVWELFMEWYGGGPAISRKCIRVGWGKKPIIEVRKILVKVIRSRKPKKFEEIYFSKATTVGEFIDIMYQQMHFDRGSIRIYDFHNGTKYRCLEEMQTTFGEIPIVDGQYILIEEKTKKGNWPNEKIYARYGYSHQNRFYNREPTPPGKTGLANLGNTCFMNSSIQCLSQTVPLVDFFLSGTFVQDINRNNPLGQKGELAEQYHDLLKELWSARTSICEPRLFKKAIEKCDVRFAGYQQHDSQELLVFLLDGIHEDLNRVQQKPYVEKVEGDGRVGDVELSKAAWEGHKARNNSIIIDNFQGLLKSTLTCPINGRISVTFDPFMYLTVPIPVQTTRKILIKLFRLPPHGPYPEKYGVTVEKDGNISDLTRELSKLCGIPMDRLFIMDVFGHRFHHRFTFHDDVSDIRDNDHIHAHEILLRVPKKRVPLIKKIEKTVTTYPPHEHQPPACGSDIPEPTSGFFPSSSPSSPLPSVADDTPGTMTGPAASGSSTTSETSSPTTLGQSSDVRTSTTATAANVYVSSPAAAADGYENRKNVTKTVFTTTTTTNTDGDETTEETAEEEEEKEEELLQIMVLFNKTSAYAELFGTPLVISVPCKLTYYELYAHIIDRISNLYLTQLPPLIEDVSDDEDQDGGGTGSASSSSSREQHNQKRNHYTPIFDISSVTNTGYPDSMNIFDKRVTSPLRLRNLQTIALHWTRQAIKDYYSDEKEQVCTVHPSAAMTRREEPSTISLYDCLNLFVKQEQLGPDDPWYCSDCKEFRQAFKKFDIYSTPSCLIIHLKRFSYRGKFSFREKLDQLIDYPLEGLDLTEFVIGPKEFPPIYDLYAVSNHYGSLGGGHYTACAKHRDDGKWYNYDDNSVQMTSPTYVNSSAAYVLFYKRRDVPWLPFDPSLDKMEASDDDEDDDTDDSDDTSRTVTTTTNVGPTVTYVGTTPYISTSSYNITVNFDNDDNVGNNTVTFDNDDNVGNRVTFDNTVAFDNDDNFDDKDGRGPLMWPDVGGGQVDNWGNTHDNWPTTSSGPRTMHVEPESHDNLGNMDHDTWGEEGDSDVEKRYHDHDDYEEGTDIELMGLGEGDLTFQYHEKEKPGSELPSGPGTGATNV